MQVFKSSNNTSCPQRIKCLRSYKGWISANNGEIEILCACQFLKHQQLKWPIFLKKTNN